MYGIDLIKNFCANLPEKPGIYKMLGEKDELLYIGKAKNLKKRVLYYSKQDIPTRLARMVFLTQKTEYLVTKSEAEAFLLEAQQIKLHQPRFNILLKDDKSFPYIKISTQHEYPQISKYRGKKSKEGEIFGPFASISDTEKAINNLKKIFKLRACSDAYFAARKRPCLQYQIKRCSAPCVNKISKEDYAETVKHAINFLKGKSIKIQEELSEEMQKFSEKMEFEKAGEIRDIIKALSYIQTNYEESIIDAHDYDVIVILQKSEIYSATVFFYRAGQNYGFKNYFPKHAEGISPHEVLSCFIGQFYQTRIPPEKILINIDLEEKNEIEEALYRLHNVKTKFLTSGNKKYKKLFDHVLLNADETLNSYIKELVKSSSKLYDLQKLLDLEELPERIEVYDNSHIMGKFAIGAMIVAGPEGFEKNEYRKFTITTNTSNFGGDDYQMLKEVLLRRINKIKKENGKIPSLMIIDGGKGHMNLVEKFFKEEGINIPFICMSKGEKRDAGGESFHMPGRESFTLSNNAQVMKYLQVLRDEAHRFAITGHRKKRSAAISASLIDEIPGIGASRKKKLLNHFGSAESLKSASIEELSKIEGISKNVAKKILEYFK